MARWNQAGRILAQHGIEGVVAARASARLPSLPLDAEDDLAAVPTRGWPVSRLRTGGPAHGRTALTSLRQASLLAHRLGHPYAGTTHLLSTLLAEPNGPAARLLYALDVDVDAVRADAGSRLGDPPSAGATADW